MAKDAIEVARSVFGMQRPCERRPLGCTEVAVWNAERDRHHGADHVSRQCEGGIEAARDVPTVDHVVDEVEPDRRRTGNHGIGTKLRQRKRRIEHAFGSEGVEQIGGRGRVGANGVGGHRIEDPRRLPHREVGTLATSSSGESVVLHGHMRKQITQIPTEARRRALEVVDRDRGDDVDRGAHGAPVQWAKILIRIHTLTIILSR